MRLAKEIEGRLLSFPSTIEIKEVLHSSTVELDH